VRQLRDVLGKSVHVDIANEAAARIVALREKVEIERQAANHWFTEANDEHNRAEKAEAERDALLGVNQCYICGGPATSHWCDLHRPSLLCRAQTKGTT